MSLKFHLRLTFLSSIESRIALRPGYSSPGRNKEVRSGENRQASLHDPLRGLGSISKDIQLRLKLRLRALRGD